MRETKNLLPRKSEKLNKPTRFNTHIHTHSNFKFRHLCSFYVSLIKVSLFTAAEKKYLKCYCSTAIIHKRSGVDRLTVVSLGSVPHNSPPSSPSCPPSSSSSRCLDYKSFFNTQIRTRRTAPLWTLIVIYRHTHLQHDVWFTVYFSQKLKTY